MSLEVWFSIFVQVMLLSVQILKGGDRLVIAVAVLVGAAVAASALALLVVSEHLQSEHRLHAIITKQVNN